MLKKFLEEYTERNSEALNASPAVFQKTSIYSTKLSNVSHNFITTLVEETKKYCKEQGYEIDRISFFSVYDADLKIDEAHSSTHAQVKLDSDLILKIVEKKSGELEAIIFHGVFVEVQNDQQKDQIS